jgi:hypothetical protein
VSPEARGLSHRIDVLVVHASISSALEAAAVGVVVASWSVPAGLAVAAMVAALRSQGATRSAVVRRVERANPALKNLIVTAEEIQRRALVTRPQVAERVFRDATLAIERVDAKTLWRPVRIAALLALAASVWIVHAALVRSGRPSAGVDSTSRRGTGSASGPGDLQVTVTVHPPSYTGLQSTTELNPSEIRAVENSRLEFSISSAAHDPGLEINGVKRTMNRQPGGDFHDRVDATRSGYALVTAGETRRLIALTVVPDALPAVRIVVPGRDLVFANGNPRLTFEARATDDFGLRSMNLRFTKVSGSGEQFEFNEGEIPLTIDRSNAKTWTGSAARTLGDFGLAEGDMLVYRAVASDGRPGAHEASSDAFFIELSRLGAAAGDAFTLPEEETRYALSQQMLIVKTERLIKSRGGVNAAEFAETAKGLAIEQRMIRSEFVFMLGGEIEDEVMEAEQSVELQEGRLGNRGQRDLRAATVAMSQAEKHLTDVNPQEALTAERDAVAALQRAFARDRYILRSLATRTPLDRTRRLTGSVTDTLTWRRQRRDAGDNRRARQMTDLLQGLGDFSSDSSSNDAQRRNRLSMLAGMAVQADPQSGAMRQAGADLQKLADSWPDLDSGERSRQVDAVANSVSEEARRALADPPAIVSSIR